MAGRVALAPDGVRGGLGGVSACLGWGVCLPWVGWLLALGGVAAWGGLGGWVGWPWWVAAPAAPALPTPPTPKAAGGGAHWVFFAPIGVCRGSLRLFLVHLFP